MNANVKLFNGKIYQKISNLRASLLSAPQSGDR